MTSVSFTFLAFRLTVRLRSLGKLLLDDYLVILSWLMLLTASILWQLKASTVYWLYDVLSGKTSLSNEFIASYADFLPHFAAWTVLFYSSLWCIKVSFLVFFHRLGSKTKVHKIWWWIVFSVVLVTWIPTIADIDWDCSVRDIFTILRMSHSQNLRVYLVEDLLTRL